eukprot:Awhi_evm3s11834
MTNDLTVSGTSTLLGDLIVDKDIITSSGTIKEGLLSTSPTLDIDGDVLRLQTNTGETIIGGPVILGDLTESTTPFDGSLVVNGGIGVAKNILCDGQIIGVEVGGGSVLAGNPVDNLVEIKEKDVNTIAIKHTFNKNIELDCYQLKVNAETNFIDNAGGNNFNIKPFNTGTVLDVKNNVPLVFEGIGSTEQNIKFNNTILSNDNWYINPDGSNNLQQSNLIRSFGSTDHIKEDLYLDKSLITESIKSTQNNMIHKVLLQTPPSNYVNNEVYPISSITYLDYDDFEFIMTPHNNSKIDFNQTRNGFFTFQSSNLFIGMKNRLEYGITSINLIMNNNASIISNINVPIHIQKVDNNNVISDVFNQTIIHIPNQPSFITLNINDLQDIKGLIIHNNTNDIFLSLAPVNVSRKNYNDINIIGGKIDIYCDEFQTSKFKVDKDGNMFSHNIQGEVFQYIKDLENRITLLENNI